MTYRRLTSAVTTLILACSLHAQTELPQLVRQSRTRAISPKAEPPEWMEWDRVRRALAFYASNKNDIDQVFSTSSLVATYAAKDIAPVLVHTGRLTSDYNSRMMSTGRMMNKILSSTDDIAQFRSENFRLAAGLGSMHRSLVQNIRPESLGWDGAVRVPMNQQAYGFVLYVFAWQPLESLAAMGKLDIAKQRTEIEDWLHLWRVLGYGMGVSEELLPGTYEDSRAIVQALRTAQYTKPGETLPEGLPKLLRGELKYLEAMLARGGKVPAEKLSPAAVQALAQAVRLSPGLSSALGLGDSPETALTRIAEASAPAAPVH